MKHIKRLGVGLIAVWLAGMLIPAAVQARTLTMQDLRKMECAREKMRILAMMFDVETFSPDQKFTLPETCGGTEKSRTVVAPEWFASDPQ